MTDSCESSICTMAGSVSRLVWLVEIVIEKMLWQLNCNHFLQQLGKRVRIENRYSSVLTLNGGNPVCPPALCGVSRWFLYSYGDGLHLSRWLVMRYCFYQPVLAFNVAECWLCGWVGWPQWCETEHTENTGAGVFVFGDTCTLRTHCHWGWAVFCEVARGDLGCETEAGPLRRIRCQQSQPARTRVVAAEEECSLQ